MWTLGNVDIVFFDTVTHVDMNLPQTNCVIPITGRPQIKHRRHYIRHMIYINQFKEEGGVYRTLGLTTEPLFRKYESI